MFAHQSIVFNAGACKYFTALAEFAAATLQEFAAIQRLAAETHSRAASNS
jgi:hypothetical protein